MNATTAHNSIAQLVTLYGELLTAQAKENAQLRAQIGELTKQLTRYARGAEVDEDDRAHTGRVASPERTGQAVVDERPDARAG